MVAPHFYGLHSSLELCCEGPWFTSIQEDECDKGAHQLYLGAVRNTLVNTQLCLTVAFESKCSRSMLQTPLQANDENLHRDNESMPVKEDNWIHEPSSPVNHAGSVKSKQNSSNHQLKTDSLFTKYYIWLERGVGTMKLNEPAKYKDQKQNPCRTQSMWNNYSDLPQTQKMEHFWKKSDILKLKVANTNIFQSFSTHGRCGFIIERHGDFWVFLLGKAHVETVVCSLQYVVRPWVELNAGFRVHAV